MLDFVLALINRELEPSFVVVEDEIGVIKRLVADPKVNATQNILGALLNLQINCSGFRWVRFEVVNRSSGKKFSFKVFWNNEKHQYLVETED